MKSRRIENIEVIPRFSLIIVISLLFVLLSFFIYLYSIAARDEKKQAIAIGSITESFGRLSSGEKPGLYVARPGPSKGSVPEFEGKSEIFRLISRVNALGIQPPVRLSTMKDHHTISIAGSLLFDENAYRLKSTSFSLLEEISHYIKKGNYPVEIVGYAHDPAADEKDAMSCWELSSLMASEVFRYLVENGRIHRERVFTCGTGNQKPDASHEAGQSGSKNRRVELIFHYQATNYVKRIFKGKPMGFFTYRGFDFRIF